MSHPFARRAVRPALLIAGAALFALLAPCAAPPARAADDAIAVCRDFFQKFQKCVDKLEGDQKEEARVMMNTSRGMVGLSDDLNRGDPMLTGMMCSGMMEELKKDKDVQKYKCEW